MVGLRRQTSSKSRRTGRRCARRATRTARRAGADRALVAKARAKATRRASRATAPAGSAAACRRCRPPRPASRGPASVKSGAATSSIFCRTVRQGSRRGSWNITPMRVSGWVPTLPVKRSSRPAMMRNNVVLPQPDGPISTVMLSGSPRARSRGWRELGVPSAPRVGLVLDADVKLACYASGLSVVQWAAPTDIRLRA